MSRKPRVSAVVLNHNRMDSLRRCLESLLRLDPPCYEIIVVDNASSDGSADRVAAEFAGRVQLLLRSTNSITAGRNEGFRAAKGEILFSADNDMTFPDREILSKAIRLFEELPEAGALACKITSPDRPTLHQQEHWWHPVPRNRGEDAFFWTTYFPEAAVFFRSEVVARTGGYDETFHRGGEQFDLMLAMLREGYRVLYCPCLVGIEEDVRGEFVKRDTEIHTLNLRNKLWSVWKHFPPGRGWRFAFPRILAACGRSLRYGYFHRFVKGLAAGLAPPSSIRSKRTPLPASCWEIYDRMEEGWFLDFTSSFQSGIEHPSAGTP